MIGGSGLSSKGHDLRRSLALEPASSEELIGDESKHEIVGDQATRFHDALDLDAERCSILDIVAEEVAGTDGVELGKTTEEALALGSFAHARCAKEDDSCGLVQSHSRRPEKLGRQAHRY